MSDLYRLRIELDDRPGALAFVSTALARRTLDIVDIAVHEVDGKRAVDEVVVRGPSHLNLDALTADLETVEAKLLSSARCEAPEDAPTAALEQAARIVAAEGRAEVVEAVEVALRAVARVGSARLLPVDAAVKFAAGRVAVGRGTAVVLRTDDLPDGLGGPHGAPRWLLAAPDAAVDPVDLAFATRPLSMRFTATDIERVAAVLAVHRSARDARRDAVGAAANGG